MKYFQVLLLCFVVGVSMDCYDKYNPYVNTLLATTNFKCDNDPPYNDDNPCMTSVARDLFETELVSQYDACALLDSSLAYTTYTYLSDWPQDFMETLAIIKYRYVGIDETNVATPETITSKSFDITASDSDHLGKLGSMNGGSTADVMNASWVYSAKYVIDYWMKQYNTLTGMGFHTALTGFTIHPSFLLNCIATTELERKQGLYIEEIFQRINEEGVGIGFNPSTPSNCPSSPLPEALKFIIQPIQNSNRGGLIQLMADGFVPIAPIAFELNTLRFVKTMDVTRDTPIFSQPNQPSMYVVVKSFSTSSPQGAYWEVVTNILPAMSVSLSLEMSPVTTYPNTHGIAAFAVGIKLAIVPIVQPTEHRVCDEQYLDPGCEELVLDSAICSDTSETILDLSGVEALADYNGFYIPEGTDCRHITDVVFPLGSNEMYCAYAADTISPAFLTVLLTKCMVVEGNSISVDGGDLLGGGRRRLQTGDHILGYVGTSTSRNTMLRSLHLHPGSYSAFYTIQFVFLDKLEIAVIGNHESPIPSFNTMDGTVSFQDCPKLSRLIIGGQSSFTKLFELTAFSATSGNAANSHQSCAYPNGDSPYESVFDINVKDSMDLVETMKIYGMPCFKHIRIHGEGSGNIQELIYIYNIGGNLLEDIVITGSSSWPHAPLDFSGLMSVKSILIDGTSLFTGSSDLLLIQTSSMLESVSVLGTDVFAGTGEMTFKLSNLPKLASVVVNGTRVMKNMSTLILDTIGVKDTTTYATHFVIDGSECMVGYSGVDGYITTDRVFSAFTVSNYITTNPVPFKNFEDINRPNNQATNRAACAAFYQYMKASVPNTC